MDEENPIETLRNGVNFALSFLDFHDVCLNEFGNAIAGAAWMFLEADGFKIVRINDSSLPASPSISEN